MAEQQEEQVNADAGQAEPNLDEEVAEVEVIEADSLADEYKRQAEENHGRYLRAQADFDNFRRRTQKEKEELAQYASLKLVNQLLPVVDNFQRALQTSGGENGEAGTFAKGVEMIYRQLFEVLENEGLKKMEPVGQPFDPEHHQAIMAVESDEHEEGIVVEVVQSGYWLKDKVIRPAMVKVSG
ncbi:nucleotide exchange factor GrpE [Cohnella faecalis]|uniref:Protein GrpE n=2 Tax=Cohnella faecalis TaxID=2315694 RepID=A0A398CXH7_9BACL|nr:nucleotide exchange factor GrpE [Cohnella faecalis]